MTEIAGKATTNQPQGRHRAAMPFQRQPAASIAGNPIHAPRDGVASILQEGETMVSLFDAFGIESPIADTRKVPLEKVCPVGQTDNPNLNTKFKFEYQTVRRTLRNIAQLQPIWCWGPSGCGKTEFFIQVAARLRRPIHVLSFGEETSIREMLGSFELKPDEKKGGFGTQFRHGALVRAITEPGAIVVLDEFNMAPAAIAAQLNRLLEARKITIPETGETIRCADQVTFAVTANTPGSADYTGIYAGSQVQNGATRSRFAGLRMTYLPPEKEAELIRELFPSLDKKVVIPEKLLSDQMVVTGNMIRTLVDQSQVTLPFTVRQLKNWASGVIDLCSIEEAFRDAYYDLLPPTESTPVSEVFHKAFGVKLGD